MPMSVETHGFCQSRQTAQVVLDPLQRVLEAADRVLDFALKLVGFAVRLQLGVAHCLADRLLY
jgi:hypothetical protein